MHRQNLTLTGAYWDALTLLPAVIPPGPVIILGLVRKGGWGARTAGTEVDVLSILYMHAGVKCCRTRLL